MNLGKPGNSLTVTRPDGKTESVDVGAKFAETDLPGVYTATLGGVSLSFAVNLSAGESKTAPIPLEELAIHGATMTTPELSAEELEAKMSYALELGI